MTKGNKTQVPAKWPAIQRPRHNSIDSSICVPWYVDVAIKNRLPPWLQSTGLAERYKIKVQFPKYWWTLPKEQAECVFWQVMNQNAAVAHYAWCWGDTRQGSWQPRETHFKTNINRYAIDVQQLVQVNIDNGRTRKIMVEKAEDTFSDGDEVFIELLGNRLARCKL